MTARPTFFVCCLIGLIDAIRFAKSEFAACSLLDLSAVTGLLSGLLEDIDIFSFLFPVYIGTFYLVD